MQCRALVSSLSVTSPLFGLRMVNKQFLFFRHPLPTFQPCLSRSIEKNPTASCGHQCLGLLLNSVRTLCALPSFGVRETKKKRPKINQPSQSLLYLRTPVLNPTPFFSTHAPFPFCRKPTASLRTAVLQDDNVLGELQVRRPVEGQRSGTTVHTVAAYADGGK